MEQHDIGLKLTDLIAEADTEEMGEVQHDGFDCNRYVVM